MGHCQCHMHFCTFVFFKLTRWVDHDWEKCCVFLKFFILFYSIPLTGTCDASLIEVSFKWPGSGVTHLKEDPLAQLAILETASVQRQRPVWHDILHLCADQVPLLEVVPHHSLILLWPPSQLSAWQVDWGQHEDSVQLGVDLHLPSLGHNLHPSTPSCTPQCCSLVCYRSF